MNLSSTLLLAAEGATSGTAVTTEGGFLLRNAWIIPVFPFVSFWLILFFGKRLPKKGAEIGIAAVGIAFALAVITGVQWIDHRDNFNLATASAAEGGSEVSARR